MALNNISNTSIDVLTDRFHHDFNEYAADLNPEVNYSREYCRHLAETAVEVRRFAEEKGELLLAHYYQRPEVQEVADFVGDSLGLGLEAKKVLDMSSADLQKKLGRKNPVTRVRMSAVRFMGDTVKIILGDKMRVFMPRFAGCSLVASLLGIEVDFSKMTPEEISHYLLTSRIKAESVGKLKVDLVDKWISNNPEGIVLSYMNSTVEAKSKSFSVFTSRNALKVLEYAMKENPGKMVLMLPDKYLTAVVKGMAIRAKNPWINPELVEAFQGACHVHEQKIGRNSRLLDEAMDNYPYADLLIHPECGCAAECMVRASQGEIKNRDSYFFSTQEMIWHAMKPDTKFEFIVATETGMIYTLRKSAPDKKFWPVTDKAVCEFMKETTLENLLESMNNPDEEKHEVFIAEDLRLRALEPIERMLKIV